MDLAQTGRFLVLFGLGAAALGLLLWGVSKLAPGLRLGRLPGDIVVEQGDFRLFVPVTTMVLASLLLTLLLWLLGVLRR
jgi:hypothetical protein